MSECHYKQSEGARHDESCFEKLEAKIERLTAKLSAAKEAIVKKDEALKKVEFINEALGPVDDYSWCPACGVQPRKGGHHEGDPCFLAQALSLKLETEHGK
jgi:hypothetical protein